MTTRKPGLLSGAALFLSALLLTACGPAATSSGTPTPSLPPTSLQIQSVSPVPSLVLPGLTSSSVAIPNTAPPLDLSGLPATSNNPAAATLGPPSWVKAGTRITFYMAAASVAQARFVWVEDPEGEWKDPSTGKSYRRTDESGEGVPTASGQGISQVDVLTVEGNSVVLATNLYLIDSLSNQFVPVLSSGSKLPGASPDGYWIHPTQLADLQEARLDNFLVLRGPYTLNNKTYDAIGFSSTTPDSYVSYVYDTKTGLLLAVTTKANGQEQNGQRSNTQLTITRFTGMRQRNLPGTAASNPSWVANTNRFDYSGTYNFTNPLDPTSTSVTFPLALQITFGEGGRNWATYKSLTTIEYPGSQPSTGNGVTGGTGIYWYDPTALKAMKQGQTLDKDPVTGERTTVRSIQGTGSNKTVTISTTLPGLTTEATYSQSKGALISHNTNIASSGTTFQLRLENQP